MRIMQHHKRSEERRVGKEGRCRAWREHRKKNSHREKRKRGATSEARQLGGVVTAVVVFFSSRRRHTSYWRDWSSDVCSSDLPWEPPILSWALSSAETTSGLAVPRGDRGSWRQPA